MKCDNDMGESTCDTPTKRLRMMPSELIIRSPSKCLIMNISEYSSSSSELLTERSEEIHLRRILSIISVLSEQHSPRDIGSVCSEILGENGVSASFSPNGQLFHSSIRFLRMFFSDVKTPIGNLLNSKLSFDSGTEKALKSLEVTITASAFRREGELHLSLPSGSVVTTTAQIVIGIIRSFHGNSPLALSMCFEHLFIIVVLPSRQTE